METTVTSDTDTNSTDSTDSIDSIDTADTDSIDIYDRIVDYVDPLRAAIEILDDADHGDAAEMLRPLLDSTAIAKALDASYDRYTDAVYSRDDGWTTCDAYGDEVHYPCATSASAAAGDYVDGGHWGDEATTTEWHGIRVWRRGWCVVDGEIQEAEVDETLLTVERHPAEPPCDDDHAEHDWRETGLQCHGAGVIVREQCKRCSCVQVTDTWAQNPETGEQGLTSVTYSTDDDYDDGDDDDDGGGGACDGDDE